MSAELRRLAEAVELETSGDWYRVDDTARIFTKNPEDVAYIAAADPQTILALLDRLARVEALADEWERIVIDDEWHAADLFADVPSALRAALAPAPTEAANVAQIGSDERVGTKEDA